MKNKQAKDNQNMDPAMKQFDKIQIKKIMYLKILNNCYCYTIFELYIRKKKG